MSPLKIITTPDTVKLTDEQIREAIMDYVHKNTRRAVAQPYGNGIVFHPTKAGAGVNRDTNVVYADATLEMVVPSSSDWNLTADLPESDISRRLENAVEQLRRYGGEPALMEIVEVIESLANVNDDYAHIRLMSPTTDCIVDLRRAVKRLVATVQRPR